MTTTSQSNWHVPVAQLFLERHGRVVGDHVLVEGAPMKIRGRVWVFSQAFPQNITSIIVVIIVIKLV